MLKEDVFLKWKDTCNDLLTFGINLNEFNDKYNQRDVVARKNMRELVNSDANKVTNVFSTLFER